MDAASMQSLFWVILNDFVEKRNGTQVSPQLQSKWIDSSSSDKTRQLTYFRRYPGDTRKMEKKMKKGTPRREIPNLQERR